MKQVILDTNFILTCIKQKIDFFEDIKLLGMQIIIPSQIIKEIKSISNSKKKLHFREIAKLSLELLKKSKFKEINLKQSNADRGIINFAIKNPEVIIATLDREIQKSIQNKRFVIRQKKKLEIL